MIITEVARERDRIRRSKAKCRRNNWQPQSFQPYWC